MCVWPRTEMLFQLQRYFTGSWPDYSEIWGQWTRFLSNWISKEPLARSHRQQRSLIHIYFDPRLLTASTKFSHKIGKSLPGSPSYLSRRVQNDHTASGCLWTGLVQDWRPFWTKPVDSDYALVQRFLVLPCVSRRYNPAWASVGDFCTRSVKTKYPGSGQTIKVGPRSCSLSSNLQTISKSHGS